VQTCAHTGEERWDLRLSGWLLYVQQEQQRRAEAGQLSDRDAVWQQYLAMLPAETEMCCLLNYSPEEEVELQLPQLVVSGAR
jgi:hypothetical protein